MTPALSVQYVLPFFVSVVLVHVEKLWAKQMAFPDWVRTCLYAATISAKELKETWLRRSGRAPAAGFPVGGTVFPGAAPPPCCYPLSETGWGISCSALSWKFLMICIIAGSTISSTSHD